MTFRSLIYKGVINLNRQCLRRNLRQPPSTTATKQAWLPFLKSGFIDGALRVRRSFWGGSAD
ncbi:hypothetical protein [Prochlorococcus marinus]|uniref:hypothetical protein n=1 Tax=Prochlorococcus marinus TaxID=1219 RepID=UPI001ADC7DE9|nr:hypothetical protein [Prochlorococcus marinus]MBO8219392.1 hypothetical protein [Prochlorococcus marinus CUG1416]